MEKKNKFKTEEEDTSKHFKNHLIVGDFEEFDFEKLFEENESKEYEGILWKNGSINSRDIVVNKGDNIYIYYTNLPDRINRILIRCSVLDDNCFYDEENTIPAMKLKFENALCVENDKERFSENTLYDKYGINNLQGKQHLKEKLKQKHNENEKEDYYQKKLIDELDKACKSSKYKNYSLKKLVDEMNKMSKCELEKCKGLKDANHKTFQKENGMNYYEGHHLIQQHNGTKGDEFSNKINEAIKAPENIINLCSNCHKRIHNGTKEDRKLMVTYLYEKNKDTYDCLLKDIIGNEQEPLKWILKQYDVSD